MCYVQFRSSLCQPCNSVELWWSSSEVKNRTLKLAANTPLKCLQVFHLHVSINILLSRFIYMYLNTIIEILANCYWCKLPPRRECEHVNMGSTDNWNQPFKCQFASHTLYIDCLEIKLTLLSLLLWNYKALLMCGIHAHQCCCWRKLSWDRAKQWRPWLSLWALSSGKMKVDMPCFAFK